MIADERPVNPVDGYPGSTLSEAEHRFLQHVTLFGSDGYPVRKLRASVWIWDDAHGVKGAPTTYKTKREAVAAVERFLDVLRDKKAGRL